MRLHPLGYSRSALLIKRLLDFIIALTFLCIAWPLMLAIALAVKMSSPGPVFYRGLRSGYKGRTFYILKFRTMVQNAESLGGPTTGTNDPRVTRVGAFLRKTKFDELPQFINVLVGEMSLVGPRPEVLLYTSLYKGEEKLILAMKPGITDYSSLEFANLDDLVGSEEPDEYFKKHILPRKNELRINYVKTWSLAGDMRILYQTAFKVIKKIFK